jgi:type I restriction enzyme M protein
MARSITQATVIVNPAVRECVERGFLAIDKGRVHYQLNQKRSYDWSDPEEWVRCLSVAFLIIERQYPANRIRVEVSVPRRTPNDHADVVVYSDDRCRTPYLVVENKAEKQTSANRTQGVEQLFGNANSLRAPFGLYDEGDVSIFFDIANFPSMERTVNRRGDRNFLQAQYGETPVYAFYAGTLNDISPATRQKLENRIRRAFYHLGRREARSAHRF